jgi:hypothetical protein
VNGFITLLQSVRHFPISEAEKRVLYNIINNTQRDSSNKIKIFSLISGFKIAILFNENNIISSNLETNNDNVIFAIHQVESLMKKNLSKDSKFLNLLSAVSNEFNSGYDDFTSFLGQDNKQEYEYHFSFILCIYI